MRLYLKGLRIQSDLTVSEMAEKLGVSESFYYKIESGVRNPTISLAKQICDILGGNVERIFFAHNMDDVSKNISSTTDDSTQKVS